MAPTRFGTDGVRGVANEELTPELALAIGRAAARVLPAPTFVVGRDTRRSGPLLQAAFSAGLAAEGADVVDLGVLPTPGVAAVAESRKSPGAVISASHNPFADNGIKLFSLQGTKLPVEVEGEIERELDSILADPDGIDMLAVVEVAAKRINVLGDVAIGEDVSLRRNDDPAARGPALRKVPVQRRQPDRLNSNDGGEHTL